MLWIVHEKHEKHEKKQPGRPLSLCVGRAVRALGWIVRRARHALRQDMHGKHK